MKEHRLKGGILLLLKLDRLSDVLTGLRCSAKQVQHKGAVASCSRVLGCFVHGSITTLEDGLKLICPEGLKTAWCRGVVLS